MIGDKKKVEETLAKEKKSCELYSVLKSWKEIEIGGIIKNKNSECQFTGSWRTFRPIRDEKICINCMFCWSVCPDNAVVGDNGNFGYFNYNHCKGCGLCAKICPVKCIAMKDEAEFRK